MKRQHKFDSIKVDPIIGISVKQANNIRKGKLMKLNTKARRCRECHKPLSGHNKKDICNPCNEREERKFMVR